MPAPTTSKSHEQGLDDNKHIESVELAGSYIFGQKTFTMPQRVVRYDKLLPFLEEMVQILNDSAPLKIPLLSVNVIGKRVRKRQ